MIDSHRRRALLLVCLAVGLCAAGAAEQQPPRNVPQNVKAAATLGPADVSAVNAFVAAHFNTLSDANAENQKASRETLVNESKGSGVTPDYQAKYAAAVDAEALKLLGGAEKGIRPRLAAAIVVARVAENTASTALHKSVLALLKDPSPAMQLWGMRGARVLMKALVAQGGQPQQDVLKLIVPVAKANGTGPIIDEAYDALAAADAAGYDLLLDLAEHRLSLYQKRTPGTPEDPIHDAKPWGQLGGAGTWAKLTPKQQLRTMEGMCTMLNVAAKRGDEADGLLEDQLRDVVSKTAANMYVVVGTIPNVPQAQRDALQLTLKQIANGAKGGTYQLVPATQPVCPEIGKLPGFQNMKMPPAIE
jgi:hypothetical protein